jgi:cytochrome c oxidase subunit 4
MTTPEPETLVAPKTYVLVWTALMILLGATFVAYCFDLGALNAVLNLVIACAKAMLVVLFFMHVRYQPRLIWIWAGVGFYWLGIMLVLTFGDYLTRGWPPIPGK